VRGRLAVGRGWPFVEDKARTPCTQLERFLEVRSSFHFASTCFSRSGKLTFWSTLSNISLPEKYGIDLWDEPCQPAVPPRFPRLPLDLFWVSARSDLESRRRPPALTIRLSVDRSDGPTRLRHRRTLIVLRRLSGPEIVEGGDQEVGDQDHDQKKRCRSPTPAGSSAAPGQDRLGDLPGEPRLPRSWDAGSPRRKGPNDHHDDEDVQQVDQDCKRSGTSVTPG